EPSGPDEQTERIDCREPVLGSECYDQIPMQDGGAIWQYNKATIRCCSERIKDLLHVCGRTGSLARYHLQREGTRCILCRPEEIVKGSRLGITQKAHPRRVRCDLFDHCKPFPDDA